MRLESMDYSPSACRREYYQSYLVGKMLGGSTSINAQVYQIGDPSDFDQWEVIQDGANGADMWNYSNFKPYLDRIERFEPRSTGEKLDITDRCTSGPVQVGFHGNLSPVVSAWINSCVNIGISPTQDFNTTAGSAGVSQTMTYISPSKKRVSSESAYLTPEVLKRPNLTVAIHAHVNRIIFDNQQKAIGVEFLSKKSTFQVGVKGEVILSAGAIHTPAILMRSGIGSKTHLEGLGIRNVSDLPGVGSHLMDHPLITSRFKLRPGLSYNFLTPRSLKEHLQRLGAVFEYLIKGTGPMSSNAAEALAFVRSTDEMLFPASEFSTPMEDRTSSDSAPDLELTGMCFAFTDHGKGPIAPGDSVCFTAIALRPKSLGSVNISSRDPFAEVEINPNYLSEQYDVDVLIRGYKMMLKIAASKPFSSLTLPVREKTTSLLEGYDREKLTDEELDKLVRDRVETAYHPTSTARMAPRSKGGVVDPFLRVYGLTNVRVVDASVFPTIVSGHPAAACMALGERASELIRASRVAGG